MNVVIQPFHPRLSVEKQEKAAALVQRTDNLLEMVDRLDEQPLDRAQGVPGQVVLSQRYKNGNAETIAGAEVRRSGHDLEAVIQTDGARFEVHDHENTRNIRVTTNDSEGYRNSLRTLSFDMSTGHVLGYESHEGHTLGRSLVEGLKEPMVWVMGGAFGLTTASVAIMATQNLVVGAVVGLATLVGSAIFADKDSQRPVERE